MTINAPSLGGDAQVDLSNNETEQIIKVLGAPLFIGRHNSPGEDKILPQIITGSRIGDAKAFVTSSVDNTSA